MANYIEESSFRNAIRAKFWFKAEHWAVRKLLTQLTPVSEPCIVGYIYNLPKITSRTDVITSIGLIATWVRCTFQNLAVENFVVVFQLGRKKLVISVPTEGDINITGDQLTVKERKGIIDALGILTGSMHNPFPEQTFKQTTLMNTEPEDDTIVIYGNSGGIDKHRDNAVITKAKDLAGAIEKILLERKELGIVETNVVLRPYAYDDRIKRHVWMLVSDRDGHEQQFVNFLYIDRDTYKPIRMSGRLKDGVNPQAVIKGWGNGVIFDDITQMCDVDIIPASIIDIAGCREELNRVCSNVWTEVFKNKEE